MLVTSLDLNPRSSSVRKGKEEEQLYAPVTKVLEEVNSVSYNTDSIPMHHILSF
jgi:hypothetical protein